MLGSTAKTLADSTANSAVVAAIAPICVDQFQRSAAAADNLTALKKTDSWQQAAYVEKGGWATMPGSKAADSGVSQACAAILSAACNSRPRVRPRSKDPLETRQSGRQCFACLRRQRLKPNQMFARGSGQCAASGGLNRTQLTAMFQDDRGDAGLAHEGLR
jgi:hypothetical protein